MAPKKQVCLIVSLALCLLGTGEGAAWAQSASGAQIAPQHPTVDQNGVDLGTGLWAGELAHISIGDPGNGGMTWSQPANGPDTLSAVLIYGTGGNRSVNASGYTLNGNVAEFGNNGFGSFSDAASCNTTGSLSYLDIKATENDSCSSPLLNQADPDKTAGATVIYMGQMHHFWGLWNVAPGPSDYGHLITYWELKSSGTMNTFGCYIGSANGEYLGCIFTATDGTVVHFPAFNYYIAPSGQVQTPSVFQATDVVKPNGEIWTYYGSSSKFPGVGWAPNLSYGVSSSFDPSLNALMRPAAIVSNRGYTIKYLWDSNSLTEVVAYNTGEESCVPTASQCTFSHDWPKVHISYTPYNSTTKKFTLNVSNAAGYTTQYLSTFTTVNNHNFPISTAITSPSGYVEGFTMDTSYIGWGYPNDIFGRPGNIDPPVRDNTQHVSTYYKGQSTWSYNYNYKYIDLGVWVGSKGFLGTGPVELFYLDLETTRHNPLGATRTVTSLINGAAISDVDELGRTTTLTVCLPGEPYISDCQGHILSATNPDGEVITYKMGRNATFGGVTIQKSPSNTVDTGGVTQISTTYNYDNICPYNNAYSYVLCNKPSSIVDAKGNVTNFTYDTIHGGVLTETGPADANGVRPQTRYAYQQFTAQGQTTPVWLLTSMSTCRAATSANAAACANTAAETVTKYEYDVSNLLPTKVTVRAGNADVTQAASATNVWATTTYAYDDIGNRTMVDGPLPGAVDQTLTMYDVLRRPVYEMGGDADGGGALPRVITHHLYDLDGREYRTETGTGYGSLVLTCSVTATTCSNFTVTSYTQRTYDPTTGLEVKSITAQP